MLIQVTHHMERFPRSEDVKFNAAIEDFRAAFKAAMEKCDNEPDETFNEAVKAEMERNGYIERWGGIETPNWAVAWNNNDDTAILTKKH